MNRKSVLLGGMAVVLVGGMAAVGVGYWLLGPTLAPSGEITAVPLEVTQVVSQVEEATAEVVVANTETPAVEAEAEATAAPETDESLVWQIDQAGSQVRFILSEELRGQPTTVIGASNQVAGEIAFDLDDLSTAQLGVIQINARTLETDSGQRDRAIRNFILNTDAYEYITFTPSQIIGLDGSAAPGETVTFQVAGDLTIRDVTQPVTFEVTATVDEDQQLSGTAVTTVLRGDYGLEIPSVPSVANVSEEVRLEIDFLATAA